MASNGIPSSSHEAAVERLSDGQKKVLRLVAAHHSSKEIASILDISPHTVDQRVRQSLALLGVSRRQQAARILVETEALPGEDPYQRLIHQSPHMAEALIPAENDGAIGNEIRHAGRAGSSGAAASISEQDVEERWFSLPLPFATRSNPRNVMGVGTRLIWIVLISIGALFSAGMYLAGLESLSRFLGG